MKTIKQMKQELSTMQDSVNKLQHLIDEEENKPSIVDGVYVKAPERDKFYYSSRAQLNRWDGSESKLNQLAQGNCFETEEAALAEIKRRQILQTMRECGGHSKTVGVREYILYLNVEDSLWTIDSWIKYTLCNNNMPVWFDTREQCSKCLEILESKYGVAILKETL